MKSRILSHIKNPWITLPILFIVLSVFMKLSDSTPAAAQKAFPEKALQLGAWIDEQAVIFTTNNQEEKAAIAKAAAAGIAKVKASETAQGYRKALCLEFELIRKDGAFVESPACAQDFQ